MDTTASPGSPAARSVAPGVVAYNAALGACGRASSAESAAQLLRRMDRLQASAKRSRSCRLAWGGEGCSSWCMLLVFFVLVLWGILGESPLLAVLRGREASKGDLGQAGFGFLFGWVALASGPPRICSSQGLRQIWHHQSQADP